MKHNWELLEVTFGCSRCGLLCGVENDDDCPAISDGEMYKRHPKMPPLTQDEIDVMMFKVL